MGPLVAHLQTIFVTAVSSSDTTSKSPNIVSTKPQRIIVHQPSSPLPVMRAPRITTCRLLTRFVPVNTFISQNAVAIVSPPGKWCGSKKRLWIGYFMLIVQCSAMFYSFLLFNFLYTLYSVVFKKNFIGKRHSTVLSLKLIISKRWCVTPDIILVQVIIVLMDFVNVVFFNDI